MSTSLWVSDASPLYFYSPAAEYFNASSATTSWTGGLNGALQAPNNSFHSTEGPSGLVLPSIYSTSITPIWNASSLFIANLAINSNSATDFASGASSPEVAFGAQTYQINVRCTEPGDGCSTEPFQFLGAYINTELVPTGSSATNVTLDDASNIIQYSGFTALSSGSTSGISVDSTDLDQTLSITSTAGASAQVNFQGSAISVNGVTAPSTGLLKVTLDGTLTATLNTTNDVVTHDVLLYFTSNLDTTKTHTLLLEAEARTGDGTAGLVIDSFTAYGPDGTVGFIGTVGGSTTTIGPSSTATGGSSGNGTSGGTVANAATSKGQPNAGAIVGAVIGSIAGAGLLFYIFRRVSPSLPKKEDKKMNPWDQANMLQNMKNEEVHVTTAVNQRYVYPGLIAHSNLKK